MSSYFDWSARVGLNVFRQDRDRLREIHSRIFFIVYSFMPVRGWMDEDYMAAILKEHAEIVNSPQLAFLRLKIYREVIRPFPDRSLVRRWLEEMMYMTINLLESKEMGGDGIRQQSLF